MKVVELAPAKLNLTLDVGAKHHDGYHDVTSVMTSAALHDMVTVESKPDGGISLSCSDATLPCDESNLAYRAAKLFFDHFGIECEGLHIHLEKHIPMQAGLGGGSSDAAAVLRALRQLYAPNMKLRELERISIQLGSDVPYCICGATTLVQGRGEQLMKLSKLPECWFVLVKPEESYSTAAMYRRIDDEQPACAIDTEGMLQALDAGSLPDVIDRIGNIFEYVLPENSAVPAIRSRLTELGADAACMSGSGSAVFGLFADEQTAAAACEAMKAEGLRAWLAKRV